MSGFTGRVFRIFFVYKAGYQTLQPALQNAPKDTILKRKNKKFRSGDPIPRPKW